MMMRLTDVVRNLLIINVLVFLGSELLLGNPSSAVYDSISMGESVDFRAWGRYMLAVFYPTSEYFRPFQLVTYMFMHADPMHLIFNMLALAVFGPGIELVWGSRRFLFYYLFTGFGALALNFLVQYWEMSTGRVSPLTVNVPMLGASGAIFGVLAAYGLLFPNNIIQMLFPPIALPAWLYVIIFAGLELVMGISGYQSGVAHFAHLGGALFGFLLIQYWWRFGTRL
jgi:membrane associated rhomboid family serine protease